LTEKQEPLEFTDEVLALLTEKFHRPSKTKLKLILFAENKKGRAIG
jgi:hypothetical protein